MLILVNGELVAFFCIFYYILAGQRIFNSFPLFSHFQIISSTITLIAYFFGLFVFHATFPSPQSKPHSELDTALDEGLLQLRLILPFTLPFLFFTLIVDIFSLYNENLFTKQTLSIQDSLVLVGGTIIFMILIMIFLPFFIQWIWKCQEMNQTPLRKRLEKICERANFRCGGIKIWTIMRHSLTAAILGIVPRFRYIMFTERILNEFSAESLEAILAHEIGHSRHKHLLMYPFILLGMLISAGLFSQFLSKSLIQFLIVENRLYPSWFWALLEPLSLFILYACLIGLYFRFVFGFFSRLFERQADLHVYALQIPPVQMIEALDHIGIATGYSHRIPNWHHYSIQERIDFLKSTIETPKKIEKHHRLVRLILIGYFLLLAAGLFLQIFQ